jgi:hypothetical protein
MMAKPPLPFGRVIISQDVRDHVLSGPLTCPMAMIMIFSALSSDKVHIILKRYMNIA